MKPMKRNAKQLAITVFFAIAWHSSSGQAQPADVVAGQTAKRPNIVFIFSDDHAVQAMGCYDSNRNKTPQLDRLAREGVVFDRAFCANSICGPSRACVLTGLHSHLNGFRRNGDRFDGSQPTLPRLLQAAGYQTALLGKWHLDSDPTGFDHWEILPDQGHYYNPDFLAAGGKKEQVTGYVTDVITDKSLAWLENSRTTDTPFLLCVWHKAPHRNWSPPLRHFGRYPHGSIPEPPTLRDDWSCRSPLLAGNEMTIARHFHWGHDMKFHGENRFPDHFAGGIGNGEYGRMNEAQQAAWDAFYERENAALLERLEAGSITAEEVLAWKYQRYLHDYLGCVQSLDDNVGRVLDWLDESGQADNTIVVYSSDQGFYLGEHGWYDKRWMFEESLRMPLVVRWPGVTPPGTRSSALVQNIDFAPTLLEAAGAADPDSMQGTSLMPLLKNPGQTPSAWRDAIYYRYYDGDPTHAVPGHDGIRTDRLKLIHFDQTGEWNLFDLETDPRELKSLHDNPDCSVILTTMKTRYNELRAEFQVNSGE